MRGSFIRIRDLKTWSYTQPLSMKKLLSTDSDKLLTSHQANLPFTHYPQISLSINLYQRDNITPVRKNWLQLICFYGPNIHLLSSLFCLLSKRFLILLHFFFFFSRSLFETFTLFSTFINYCQSSCLAFLCF